MKTLPLNHTAYIKVHKDFERAILAMGYSDGDHTAYPRQVREFLFFLETKDVLDVKDIKVEHVISYWEYLMERPSLKRENSPLSVSYIRQHITAISHFLEYLFRTKQIGSVPVTLPRFNYSGASERYVPSKEEVDMLYKAATKYIERAVLASAYGCGLRREEIAMLNVNDVDFTLKVLIVRKGKNNKKRTVPMARNVITYLKEYIAYERPKRIKPHMPPTNALFINQRGRRMGEQMLNLKVTNLVAKTPLKGKPITIHCLRHAIGTHMMDNGATMEEVRKFLDHEMLNTTQIYTKRRKQKNKLYKLFREHLAEHNAKKL